MDLLGRGVESAAVQELIAAKDGAARAMLVVGVAGVGKSALLNHAAATARSRGALIFRSVGVETEVGLQFSGLHQLLRPLRNRVDSPPDTRNVLDDAFRSAHLTSVQPFEIANAVLDVLESASKDARVVCVVDDVQWLDEASSNVLAFVARRIESPRVSLLVGSRPEGAGRWMRGGIPVLELGPVNQNASEALLDVHHPALPAELRRRVLDLSQGNPLALLQLPHAISLDMPLANPTFPDQLPLSERLEAVFADKVRGLSDRTFWSVLMAALDRTGLIETIRVAAGPEWNMPELRAAHDAGVLELSGNAVRFTHPLVRSAVVQMTLPDKIRSAHAALANALHSDPELWAWHRAYAVTGTDSELGDALEAVGRASLRKGGAQAAIRALLRAATLTPDLAGRARRLAFAAYLANETGQLALAHETIDQVVGTRTPGGSRELDAETAGWIAVARASAYLRADGNVVATLDCVTTALHGVTNGGTPWVAELLNIFVRVCIRSTRRDHWEALDLILDRMGDTAPLEILVSRDALSDPARTAHGIADRINALTPRILESQPWRAMLMATASLYIDNLPAQRHVVWKIIDQDEIGGSAPSYAIAVLVATLDQFVSGRWAEARELAQRSIRWTEKAGLAELSNDFHAILAMIAASEGDRETLRRELRVVEEWTLPRGLGLLPAWIEHVKMRALAGEGRHAEAHAAALRVSPDGVLAPFQPHALWMFAETVFAAWFAGLLNEARRYVSIGEAERIDEVSPRLAFHLASARAVTAEDEVKRGLFDLALRSPGIETWPFEHGRLELAYGEWLRLNSDALGARSHLTAALDVFERLGAAVWAARARNELRATRVEPRARLGLGAITELTPQEQRIAGMAAGGLSNKEIASRLHLSPRTVSAHLYKVYPKLGIASRASLYEALMTRNDATLDNS